MSSQEEFRQLATFYVEKDLYGIEVMRVQEVTGKPKVISVPLAPDFVLGMINLRGQIATALGLRVLFGHPDDPNIEKMSVVCKIDGNLVSLIVDTIGEVVEVNTKQFESPPETIPVEVRKLLKGICKFF
jgi:purine-binding chemotaxis protein CheW